MLMMLRSVTYQSCVAMEVQSCCRAAGAREDRTLNMYSIRTGMCISDVPFVNMLYAAEQLTKAWIGFL